MKNKKIWLNTLVLTTPMSALALVSCVQKQSKIDDKKDSNIVKPENKDKPQQDVTNSNVKTQQNTQQQPQKAKPISNKKEDKKTTQDKINNNPNTNGDQNNTKFQDPSSQNEQKNELSNQADNQKTEKQINENSSTSQNNLENKNEENNVNSNKDINNTQSNKQIEPNNSNPDRNVNNYVDQDNVSQQNKNTNNDIQTQNTNNQNEQQNLDQKQNEQETNLDNQKANSQPKLEINDDNNFANYKNKITELLRINGNFSIQNAQILKNVNNANQNYVLLKFNSLGKYEFNSKISFKFNETNYSFDFDNNSLIYLFKLNKNETLTQTNKISDIKINNHLITNDALTVNEVVNQSSTTNLRANSASFTNNQIQIDLSGSNNSLQSNQEFYVTLKPDRNYLGSDITLKGIFNNNKIVINDHANFDFSINKWVITRILNTQNLSYVKLPKDTISNAKNENSADLTLSISKNFSGDIESISINSNNSNPGQYLGSIKLNQEAITNLNLLKQKYVRLDFTDKHQIDLDASKPYPEHEKGYYTNSVGLNYRDRKDRISNKKYIYLNYDQLSNFAISNLPSGIHWQLNKIELVDKSSNLVTKTLTNNTSNTDFYTEISENIQLNHGYENDYNKQNLQWSINKTINDDENNHIDKNLSYTDENYIKANDYYISQTQYYFLKDDNSDKTFTRKFDNITLNNKEYNFATLAQHFKDKEFISNKENTQYTYTIDLSRFKNIDNKNLIFSLNFFATPLNIEPSHWRINQNSYKISFSYEKLKQETELDNIAIEFVKKWTDIYKFIARSSDLFGINDFTLDQNKLEKLINENLRVNVKLQNNKILITLNTRKGVLNSKIHLHNLSQKLSTYVEKFQNYLSLIYTENKNVDVAQKLSFNPNSSTNDLQLPDFIFSKKNDWKILYSTLDNSTTTNDAPDFEFTTNRTTTNDLHTNPIIKDVVAREFGLYNGTGWVIAKVKPDDDNDNRYYIATNQHVPTHQSEPIFAPKDHVNEQDTSHWDVNSNWSVGGSNPFWRGDDSKEILGNEVSTADAIKVVSKKRYSGIDLKIHIFDTTEAVKYYNDHKNDSNIDTNAIFQSAKAIYNWKNLNKIKFSERANYIKSNTLISTYASSFPGSTAGNTKRNIQIRHNIVTSFTEADNPGGHNYTDSETLAFWAKFKNTNLQSYNALQAGSSGTGVFDDEGNFLAIHAGKSNGYNFSYILNNPRIAFIGYLNGFNDNSFAYKVQRLNRLYPDLFGLPEIFSEFEKPF